MTQEADTDRVGRFILSVTVIQQLCELKSLPARNKKRLANLSGANQPGTGSLIMDAALAALSLEHGATICTHDRDFSKFPSIQVRYPLLSSLEHSRNIELKGCNQKCESI